MCTNKPSESIMQCSGGKQMDAMVRLGITIECLTDLSGPRVPETQKM